MTEPTSRESRTLEVAEKVSEILSAHGIQSAVIGAMALAVYRYVRATRDFDLGCCADPFSALREVQRAARDAGFQAELRLPDAEDPLGGVLEVTGPSFKPVQLVNYYNPLAKGGAGAALGRESIEAAQPGLIEGSRLRVVTLAHLVALKLYAGGPKNRSDVIELLERNRPLDLGPIAAICARHGLESERRRVLEELRTG